MRRLLTGLAALVAVTSAGCGGAADTPHARQQFLGRANSICSHFSDLQNQVQFPSVNPVAAATTHAQRAEWAVALKQVAYLGTQEVKALRKLEAPRSLQPRFATLLAAKDAAFGHLLDAVEAAKRNRVPGLRTAAAAGRVGLARATRAANALGARRCR